MIVEIRSMISKYVDETGHRPAAIGMSPEAYNELCKEMSVPTTFDNSILFVGIPVTIDCNLPEGEVYLFEEISE